MIIIIMIIIIIIRIIRIIMTVGFVFQPLQEMQMDLNLLSEAIEALCASAVHPLPVYTATSISDETM
jgi:hypothetical protein